MPGSPTPVLRDCTFNMKAAVRGKRGEGVVGNGKQCAVGRNSDSNRQKRELKRGGGKRGNWKPGFLKTSVSG